MATRRAEHGLVGAKAPHAAGMPSVVAGGRHTAADASGFKLWARLGPISHITVDVVELFAEAASELRIGDFRRVWQLSS